MIGDGAGSNWAATVVQKTQVIGSGHDSWGCINKKARLHAIGLFISNSCFNHLAEWTGLEPATPGVTGRYSNQLNYHSALVATLCSFEPSAAKLGDPTGIRTPVLTVKG